ncbi:hypothetical protein AD998_19530 [bacterium 336/3]|nr:hypothetical protein AD998_19530 [bacterium 336/3]
MINFFRSSSIGGTILLAILFLAVRIPAYILGVDISATEVKYLALAEKIAQGDWLYLDIWDNSAPFSAFFYTILYGIFGKTNTPYLVISGLLVFIQAIQWSYWLVRTKMYQERNQVPAIIYLVMACLWADCYTLSPEIMANTFLIMALGNTFMHLNEQNQTEKSFEIGLYLGIAGMFHLPYFLFVGGVILAFLLFSGTRFKEYVLLCLGLLLPFTLIGLVFYFKNGFPAFVNFFIVGFINVPHHLNLDTLTFITIGAFPVVLTLFSFLALLQSVGFINYQLRCQQSMFLVLIFGVIAFFINPEIGIGSLAILWCALSFFIAHLFLLFKKRILRNIIFLLFLFIGIGINFAFLLNTIPKDLQSYYPKPKKIVIPPIKQSKVWVLSSDVSWYLYNKAITPFFNWDLSKKYLQKLDYYDIQADIYNKIMFEKPHIIVGDEKTIELLFNKLPTIAERYVKEKYYWKLKK